MQILYYKILISKIIFNLCLYTDNEYTNNVAHTPFENLKNGPDMNV